MTQQTATSPMTSSGGTGGSFSARRGALAAAFQEVFTVAIRVRNRQQGAPDAESFRAHVKQLLGVADGESRRAGYDPEYVRLAVYAWIALLDESVLNSNQAIFASWPRQSLQEEVFGDHIAGENFFAHLQQLMSRQDSEDLADVLEVFLLCLLLGFRGRYAFSGEGGTERIQDSLLQRIRRIRGGDAPLSIAWALPTDEVMPGNRDRWVPKLAALAGGSLVLCLVLFIAFRLSLSAGISDLRTLATQLIR